MMDSKFNPITGEVEKLTETKEVSIPVSSDIKSKFNPVEGKVELFKEGAKGCDGPIGMSGDRGPMGHKGHKGDQGIQGEPGPKGDPGEEGPIGPKGDKGDPGEPGKDSLNREGGMVFKSKAKPDPALGLQGDWAFNELGEVYYKENDWKFFHSLGGGGGVRSAGTLALSSDPLDIAGGGTNNTSFNSGGVLYYDGTKIADDASHFAYDPSAKQLTLGASGDLFSALLLKGSWSNDDLTCGFFMENTTNQSTDNIIVQHFLFNALEYAKVQVGSVNTSGGTESASYDIYTVASGTTDRAISFDGSIKKAILGTGWVLQLDVALGAVYGGTGLSTYSQGDMLYASASNTLSALAKNTSSTRYLSNTGSNNNPAWAQVNLANGVTGTLPEGNGGTNITTYSQGDILYASAANTLSKLAKNTTASRYLSNSGSSNNPAWSQIDLTNGVTGALPVANGGTGDTTGGGMCPVGGVIALLKSLTGTPALVANYVECNGQTLSDAGSVYNGVVIPNLNASGGGTKRFLRGSTTSGTTAGADTYTPAGTLGAASASISTTTGSNSVATAAHTHVFTGTNASYLPSHYEVVWVMRIK